MSSRRWTSASKVNVKVNVATGNESFEAWRERDRDDLVLATALPLWYSERAQRLLWTHRVDGSDAGREARPSQPPPPADGLGAWEFDEKHGWTRPVRLGDTAGTPRPRWRTTRGE